MWCIYVKVIALVSSDAGSPFSAAGSPPSSAAGLWIAEVLQGKKAHSPLKTSVQLWASVTLVAHKTSAMHYLLLAVCMLVIALANSGSP